MEEINKKSDAFGGEYKFLKINHSDFTKWVENNSNQFFNKNIGAMEPFLNDTILEYTFYVTPKRIYYNTKNKAKYVLKYFYETNEPLAYHSFNIPYYDYYYSDDNKGEYFENFKLMYDKKFPLYYEYEDSYFTETQKWVKRYLEWEFEFEQTNDSLTKEEILNKMKEITG